MHDPLQPRGGASATSFGALVFLATTSVTLAVLLWRRDPAPAEGPEDPLGTHRPRDVELGGALAPHELRHVQVFESAAASVVHVDAVGVALHMRLADDPPEEDGIGSGFVWSERGHIVTSLHVVRDRGSGTSVTFANGERYPAEYIGASTEHDLAVLAVAAPPELLYPIRVGDSAGLRIGQDVLAIGSPLGLDHTFTAGVISGLGRSIRGDAGVIEGVLQHDAAIHPGSSGGPLLDSAGHLIGINTARSGIRDGLSFAIPADVINEVVPQIIADGFEFWPELGCALMSDRMSLELLTASGWTRETGLDFGVIIVEVHPDGPADRAGLESVTTIGLGQARIRDVIVGVDGVPLASRDQLTTYLSRVSPGDEVRLDLRRSGGVPQEVAVVFRGRVQDG